MPLVMKPSFEGSVINGQIRAVDRHSQQPAMISNDEAALLRAWCDEEEPTDELNRLVSIIEELKQPQVRAQQGSVTTRSDMPSRGNSRAAFPPNQFNGTILYSANQTVDFSLEILGYDPRDGGLPPVIPILQVPNQIVTLSQDQLDFGNIPTPIAELATSCLGGHLISIPLSVPCRWGVLSTYSPIPVEKD
eukprot:gene25374-33914_t